MRRFVVPIVSAALILCSCAASGDYGIKINKEEQETEYSVIYAEIAEFSGFPDKEYQSELNSKTADDVRAAIAQFDEMALETSEVLPEGIKCDMRLTQDIKRNSGGIISFVEAHYLYLGGAHGNTTWYPQTIDIQSESPHNLELGELFESDSYLDDLNNILERLTEDNPDKYSELWAQPNLTKENENRFYLTDDALVIYFPPYELSYYAKGFIEFPVPLTDIGDILKAEYRPANAENAD